MWPDVVGHPLKNRVQQVYRAYHVEEPDHRQGEGPPPAKGYEGGEREQRRQEIAVGRGPRELRGQGGSLSRSKIRPG